MGARFFRADTGTTVGTNAGGTGGIDLSSDLLLNKDDQTTIALATLLANLQASLTPQAGPVAALANEQSARAKMGADSYAPGTQYLEGLNPGGLFDTISRFIGGLGGNANGGPQLEQGQREVNRVPLDMVGGTFQDVINKSNLAATQPSSKYNDAINQLIAPLLARLSGADAKATPSGAPAVGSTYSPGAPTTTVGTPYANQAFTQMNTPTPQELTDTNAVIPNQPVDAAGAVKKIIDELAAAKLARQPKPASNPVGDLLDNVLKQFTPVVRPY